MNTCKTNVQQRIFICFLSAFFTLHIQITYSQNVGIGTTNPQAKLDVVNSLRVGGVNKYILYDSTSGKFIWNNSTLFIPVQQQIIQHSASGEGLYYGVSQLLYRGVFDTAFFTDWSNGNGYFRGQLGLGTYNPHASAKLEIQSTDKGILIPRLTSLQRTGIVGPATGLLVYDVNTQGFQYWNGSSWQNISTLGNVWALNGNAGTNPVSHFIGTTDNNSLLFKVNNQKAGYVGVETNDGNVFWGYQSGNVNTGYNNVGIGIKALYSNTNQSNLVAIGDFALFNNTSGNNNTAIGSKSLFSNTTGYNNTANGYQTLYANKTGFENTANGWQALDSNTTGFWNTATGSQALFHNTNGIDNTANGNAALFSNTTGQRNTANGSGALYSNTSGLNNVANGSGALNNNTTGFNNTANGNEALFSNTTGNNNVANGANALISNTTGNNNTANGFVALYYNTTGNYNVANGSNALVSNTTGSSNTANGYQALYANTTGYQNTASGWQALDSNTTGGLNTANGSGALFHNTTGNSNTANGAAALYSNTSGSANTANGIYALNSNTIGSFNVANGFRALFSNTTGNYNVANGIQTLYSNTSGGSNTANGVQALYGNTIGNSNTANGYDALSANSIGNNNTASGFQALNSNTTGSNNSAFGYLSDVVTLNQTNATAIGANAQVNCSNCLVLGSVNGVNGATSNVNVGMGTTNPGERLEVNGNIKVATNKGIILDQEDRPFITRGWDPFTSGNYIGLGRWGMFMEAAKINIGMPDFVGDFQVVRYNNSSVVERVLFSVANSGNATLYGTLTQSSDVRLKTEIHPLKNSLNQVLQLTGYNYHWKDARNVDELQTGVLAQEVQKVLPELVREDANGNLGVNYNGLIPHLIEAIKEEQNEIQQQHKKNEDLEKKLVEMQKQVDELIRVVHK